MYLFSTGLCCSDLACSVLYLGAVKEQEHVMQRPPLSGQLFPQGVDGGGPREWVEVKGRGAGESMDGAVGEEAG